MRGAFPSRSAAMSFDRPTRSGPASRAIGRSASSKAVFGAYSPLSARSSTSFHTARTSDPCRAQSARRGAPGDELVERVLQRQCLGPDEAAHVEAVVEDALQDDRPDPAGVALGVLRAEQRAVRAAVERQFPQAERAAEGIEVADGAQGVGVVPHRAGRPAGGPHRPVVGDRRVEVGLAGQQPRRRGQSGVGRARGAAAARHPARIETDGVEPVEDLGAEPVAAPDPLHPGVARTARAEHQRSRPARPACGPGAGRRPGRTWRRAGSTSRPVRAACRTEPAGRPAGSGCRRGRRSRSRAANALGRGRGARQGRRRAPERSR